MTLKDKIYSDKVLLSTMIKTPAYEIIEVLSLAGFDFLTLDAEHAPFDRARMDACLAIGCAKEVPLMVRIPEYSASAVLKALDSGATGIIVPHVDSVEKAQEVSRWARFGENGRGYAGSTRWAGFATQKMADLIEKNIKETIVIAQIEEPAGIEAVEEIAKTEGIDALFFGPADVAVCIGETDLNAPRVLDAMRHVAQAANDAGKKCLTFTPNTQNIPKLIDLGVTGFFVGSEHSFMLQGAKAVVSNIAQ